MYSFDETNLAVNNLKLNYQRDYAQGETDSSYFEEFLCKALLCPGEATRMFAEPQPNPSHEAALKTVEWDRISDKGPYAHWHNPLESCVEAHVSGQWEPAPSSLLAVLLQSPFVEFSLDSLLSHSDVEHTVLMDKWTFSSRES
jgi:hypothetical protein